MENIIIEPSKIVNTNKLAIFDFDWTVVRPTKGKRFPKDANDWVWWRTSVPKTIKNYAKKGYRIVFVTEQTKLFKIDMIKTVIKKLKVPITAIIAMEQHMKKPNPELFNTIITNYDKTTSFYTGDAAGREGDWADKDIRFAENIGVQFYTPEEMFPIEYRKFPKITIPDKQEIIIMIGFPGSGKSTFVNTQLIPKGYHVIDSNTYKTPYKMIKNAEQNLTKSIVFDSTNATKEKRNVFIDFAKKHNINVRCIWLNIPIEISLENIKKRYQNTGKNTPSVALMNYQKMFDKPSNSECELVII